jgi:hypothetical protein
MENTVDPCEKRAARRCFLFAKQIRLHSQKNLNNPSVALVRQQKKSFIPCAIDLELIGLTVNGVLYTAWA